MKTLGERISNNKDVESSKVRWKARYSRDLGQWEVITEERIPWCIAVIAESIPGDDTGEVTAKAICEAHNNGLIIEEARNV